MTLKDCRLRIYTSTWQLIQIRCCKCCLMFLWYRIFCQFQLLIILLYHYLSKRYEAEFDQGHAYRCCQPWLAVFFLPAVWVYGAAKGFDYILTGAGCSCDEVVCWLRKEYSTRIFFRVYPNRIEFNSPGIRIPFGILGCGSWNADHITTNPFDRGGRKFVKSLILLLLLL